MKIDYRQVGILLLITFVSFTIPIIYSLNALPAQLAYKLDIEFLKVEEAISDEILKQTLYVSLNLLLGSLGLFFFIKQKNKQNSIIDNNESIESITGQDVVFIKDKEDEEYIQKAKSKAFNELIDRITEKLNQYVEAEKDQNLLANKSIKLLAESFESCQSILYKLIGDQLHYFASYAFNRIEEEDALRLKLGEGLTGQTAKSGKTIYLDTVPENYIEIVTGLGATSQCSMLIIPLYNEKKLVGVIELAFFKKLNNQEIKAIETLSSILAKRI